MAAPPYMPRAPGGCQSGRVLVNMSYSMHQIVIRAGKRYFKYTGPMSVRVVSSRTFSIADLLGSTGGDLMRVAEDIGVFSVELWKGLRKVAQSASVAAKTAVFGTAQTGRRLEMPRSRTYISCRVLF